MTDITPTEKINEICADLRQIQRWIDAHPEIEGFVYPGEFNITTDFYEEDPETGEWVWRKMSPVEIATTVRAMKELGGKVDKEGGDAWMTYLARATNGRASLRLSVARDTVCTAKVTGQREIEVPDPDAPKVTKLVDVVEWECHPVLAEVEA